MSSVPTRDREELALTTLCQDELDRTPEPARTTAERVRSARSRREPVLMVVADQQLAETSEYEQGVAVLAGARVGPDVVDLISCSGTTEVITVAGHNIVHHGSVAGIRPSLRRAVLARDDGCTIDECTSTYRLEVHHIIPRSRGGDQTPENPRETPSPTRPHQPRSALNGRVMPVRLGAS